MRQQIQRTPKLTVQQIDSCLLHMLRDADTFAYAKQHLKPKDFSLTNEMPYALLWSSALAAAERNNGVLPNKGVDEIIKTELVARAISSHDVSEDDANVAAALLTWIFDFDITKLNPAYYLNLVKELIIERTVISGMKKDVLSYSDIGRPLDIIKNLEEYRNKLQSVLIDESKLGKTAFPKDFKPKRIGKFSTGLKYFDEFLGGGQAPNEVYTLIAPTGLGKTTTAIGLAVEAARIWNMAFLNGTLTRRKVSCFFSYEQDIDQLRLRFWCYAAAIDSTRLENYADEKVELSTKGNPEAYELVDFADEIKACGVENFDCEQERLVAATNELNETVRIFDFGGTAENPRAGEGLIDEIVLVLTALQKEGLDVGIVIVDYALAAVRKHIAAKGEDPNNRLRHYMTNYCNEMRYKVAVPFKCPVWCLSQMNAESNKKSPTAAQHHASAAECAAFSENAFFAFEFGTKDEINMTCRLFCTKSRRTRGDRPPVLLKISGNYCRLDDVSDTYTVVPSAQRIMPKDKARNTADPKDLKARINKLKPGSSSITNM